MKKLITSLAALTAFTVASYAQRSTDVSVVLISPTPAQVLNCADSFVTEFMFINSGTGTVLTTDTLVFQSPRNQTATQASITVPRQDAAPGDTIAWFRYNASVSQLGILLNETGDAVLTAPFANGNYGFYVIFDRFLSDLVDDNNTNNIAANLISINCDGGTSIKNLTATTINVYPNPAKNQITVNFDATAAEGTIRVFDVMGRTIMTQKVAKNTSAYTLDINALNNGSYFVELVAGESRGISKFAVSK